MPEVLVARTPESVAAAAERAAAAWRAGGLVAFPTETVYGLGADAANRGAVERIFTTKGRPRHHPLIVHLADADALEAWVERVPEGAQRLVAALWPGPLTLVLRKAAWVPEVVTGGKATVAIRVPQHPVALALLRAFGGGVAAPSANRFGRVSPTEAAHVCDDFAAVPDLLVIDGGACGVGVESTIVDLSRAAPRVLRLGGVALATVAKLLEVPIEELVAGSGGVAAPRVPGALERHYAPDTPTRILGLGEVPDPDAAVLARSERPAGHRGPWRTLPSEPKAAAANLYRLLRELDGCGAACLQLEMVPAEPAWAVVADRLRRAAAPLPKERSSEEGT